MQCYRGAVALRHARRERPEPVLILVLVGETDDGRRSAVEVANLPLSALVEIEAIGLIG